jgi:hypothetical protein
VADANLANQTLTQTESGTSTQNSEGASFPIYASVQVDKPIAFHRNSLGEQSSRPPVFGRSLLEEFSQAWSTAPACEQLSLLERLSSHAGLSSLAPPNLELPLITCFSLSSHCSRDPAHYLAVQLSSDLDQGVGGPTRDEERRGYAGGCEEAIARVKPFLYSYISMLGERNAAAGQNESM